MNKPSSQRYILALDVGTSSIRAVLFDSATAHAVARADSPLTATQPQPGHLQWPAEQLFTLCVDTMRRALGSVDPNAILSLGITTQRGSFCVWDKVSGAALSPIISWQDKRAEQLCESWNQSAVLSAIRTSCSIGKFFFRSSQRFQYGTRFHLSPVHASIRYKWLLLNDAATRDAAARKRLAFGTIDSWLVHRLTGGAVHATDLSCFSATGMWDLFAHAHSLAVPLLRLPLDSLPEIRATDAGFGVADAQWLGAAIPIGSVCGDQSASLFGQRCVRKGDAKVTLGTGMMLNVCLDETPLSPPVGAQPLVAWQLAGAKPTCMVEAASFACGTLIDRAVEWRVIDSPSDASVQALAVERTDVCCAPALAGLGPPWNDNRARGALLGLTLASDRRHVARAVCEALAHRCYEMVSDLRVNGGFAIERLRVDGGVSRCEFLMQYVTRLVECERGVLLHSDVDATVRGAAYFAGVAAGVWDAAQLDAFDNALRHRRVECDANDDKLFYNSKEARLQHFRAWRRAVTKALRWDQ